MGRRGDRYYWLLFFTFWEGRRRWALKNGSDLARVFSFFSLCVRREVRVMILSWRKSGMHCHGNSKALIGVQCRVQYFTVLCLLHVCTCVSLTTPS